MPAQNFDQLFNTDVLQRLLPPERTDEFFEALFGDASEGAYDISLEFEGHDPDKSLNFAILLQQRSGQCLVCSLTRGLPQVFSRHPVLNLKGIAAEIGSMINLPEAEKNWHLGGTRQHSNARHSIPFIIEL